MEENKPPPPPLPLPKTNPKRTSENGRLPPDSLLQIWSHLPLPSLYKFRTVCHLWNHLISSDPLLPTLRHTLSFSPPPPPPTLLLILRHTPSDPVKHPDRPTLLSTRPLSTLLSSPSSSPHLHPIPNFFTPYLDSSLHLLPSHGPLTCFASSLFLYLSNPSTHLSLRLSPPNPSSPPAFGFFPQTNRYVLVNLPFILDFVPGMAASAQWKELNSPCPVPVRGFGHLVNHKFFWTVANANLPSKPNADVKANAAAFVVCLDIMKEEFTLIKGPEGNAFVNLELLYDQMYLVEFKGSLCAVDNFSRPPRMQIWVLSEGEDEDGIGEFGWVRKYNIFMTGMSRDVVYPFWDYGGEGEEIVLCNETRSRLYSCNVKTKNIRQVYKPKNRGFERLGLYTPGLFPLTISN